MRLAPSLNANLQVLLLNSSAMYSTGAAAQHTAKGQPKIVKQCSLPLTSVRSVDLFVTELAVSERVSTMAL